MKYDKGKLEIKDPVNYDLCRRVINENWTSWQNILHQTENTGFCHSCHKHLFITSWFCAADNHSFCAYRWLWHQPFLIEWITR